jgi:transcriptional regulator with XRE-family HTH domain
MTARALTNRLTELGVPFSPSGISDIEAGRRTVSVDQLTALATALSVSPITLLMPQVLTENTELIRLTGTEEVTGMAALAWLQGEAPIDMHEWADAFEVEHFRRRSLPPWAWKRKEGS